MKNKFPLLLAVMILTAGIVSFNKRSLFIPSSEKNLEVFIAQNKPNNQIAEAYRFALVNPGKALLQIKCYCGCIKNQGHKNNRDCFIDEDGGIDKMGLNCGLCVKTALTAKKMLSEGKTVAEISDLVDQKWGGLKE